MAEIIFEEILKEFEKKKRDEGFNDWMIEKFKVSLFFAYEKIRDEQNSSTNSQ